jgi:hypothetical protein
MTVSSPMVTNTRDQDRASRLRAGNCPQVPLGSIALPMACVRARAAVCGVAPEAN